jgi:hypothetical protein
MELLHAIVRIDPALRLTRQYIEVRMDSFRI